MGSGADHLFHAWNPSGGCLVSWHDRQFRFLCHSSFTLRCLDSVPLRWSGSVSYLNGKKAKDPHQALFWLNNEPGDAVRRHMMAVRWKDWRLYRKYDKDPWQLFDLKSDPREAIDRAASNPQIVADLSARHAQWAATLEPQAPIPSKGREWGAAPKVTVGRPYSFVDEGVSFSIAFLPGQKACSRSPFQLMSVHVPSMAAHRQNGALPF